MERKLRHYFMVCVLLGFSAATAIGMSHDARFPDDYSLWRKDFSVSGIIHSPYDVEAESCYSRSDVFAAYSEFGEDGYQDNDRGIWTYNSFLNQDDAGYSGITGFSSSNSMDLLGFRFDLSLQREPDRLSSDRRCFSIGPALGISVVSNTMSGQIKTSIFEEALYQDTTLLRANQGSTGSNWELALTSINVDLGARAQFWSAVSDSGLFSSIDLLAGPSCAFLFGELNSHSFANINSTATETTEVDDRYYKDDGWAVVPMVNLLAGITLQKKGCFMRINGGCYWPFDDASWSTVDVKATALREQKLIKVFFIGFGMYI